MSIIGWLLFWFVMFMLATICVGECIGHDKVRAFFFWVRGRSEKTGEPVRRFPLP